MKTANHTPPRPARTSFFTRVAAGLALLALAATGCAGDQMVEPTQIIEADIDDETLDLLMTVADLGPDDDYLIYEVVILDPKDQPGETFAGVPTCIFGPEPVVSECGYCACDDSGQAFCADYGCAFGDGTDTLTPPGEGPAQCDGYEEGDSWMVECNACSCIGGQTTCTIQSCGGDI